MAGQSIDSVFDGIIKDCQTIAAEAVKNAAKKVQDDVLNETKSYLQLYYSNYKPKCYKPRSEQLQKSITPVLEDHSSNSGISIEVGVEYDSGKLKGAYHSNSRWHQSGDTWHIITTDRRKNGPFSSDNGIPAPEWIMDNFLEGIHPITEKNGNDYIYNPKKDKESTDSLMKQFFDTQLPNKINQYIQTELFNVIASRL